MKKKSIIFITLSAIIFVLFVFPIIINTLMFIDVFPVSGDEDTWIGSLSTFWGAVIGGVISGILTLMGVRLTIRSSSSEINKTIREQKKIRDEELLLKTSKERLFYFYHPVNALVSEFIFEHSAHSFTDLSADQQREFITIVNKNVIYADSILYSTFIELKWAFKEKDYETLNEKYNNIMDLITDEIVKLRNELKLPELYNHFDED